MVSKDRLMNYAAKILAGEDGYTLAEVLRSFPLYYAAIVHYMNLLLIAQQQKELNDRFQFDYNLLRADHLLWKQFVRRYKQMDEAIQQFTSEGYSISDSLDLEATYLQLDLVRQGQKLLKHKLEINKYYGLYNDQVGRITNRIKQFEIQEDNLIEVIDIIKEQMFGGDNA